MTAPVIGLIGAGGIAQVHLPGWLSLGFEVVVHSLDGNAPELTGRLGGRVAASLDELLERADIVDVVTPTGAHRELVERAAAAGRHIVCEKPLALTAADAAAMIAACERAGVRLFPAHVVRYFPAYAALHEAVASGRVSAPAVQRFFRIGARPQTPWYLDRARSGGIAMDQMIHDFDQARWIVGEVEAVFATQSGDETTTSTTVQAMLRHRSGAITHVNGVWGAETLDFHTGFSAAGPGWLLEHDSLRHPILQLHGRADAGGPAYLPPVSAATSPYTAELADFAAAIRDGGPARVSADDGLHAVRIAAAVNRSLAQNAEVTVEETP
ncbi:Gfo/Idh/MocA family protein [Gryllotalpicola protaetiae]|uniref:Gfo/Idh/MocA family protein n=1 Tax=Gryllotalpicola protaetiae TaxID=2419771 RepID=UPI0013C492A9|nr:Gfo/Idh/MocA family oxidoreductase [Gryllotalpicola protaetiae]